MDRLSGVDAARGLAVLGMVAAHVLPGADDDGSASLSATIVSGRSAAAFAVLAGVGLALATRRSTGWRARLAVLARALLIGLLGLGLAELDTGVAVVLAHYAALFALVLPFVAWPPRRLLLLAASVALAGPALSYALRPDLTAGEATFEGLGEPRSFVVELLLTGVYPSLPWTAYVLTGVAVGRLALRSARTALVVGLSGAALTALAYAASALLLGPLGGYEALDAVADREEVDGPQYGNVPTSSWWWLATIGRHSTTTPDLVATTGTALLALGACLLVGRRLVPLAAVGAMPLTVYSVHLLVLHITDSDCPVRYWLLQVTVALLACPLWRRYVGRGPLEAGLAGVTRAVRDAT